MTILNRPMFLQAGGEAGPEASMLQEAEAGAMAQGQQLGEQYAQQMMQGIDQAQSTEDLINALRGNDKPLDARRSELAGFVGQNDANETPESVLAMVQPVIMMTEEGVMDSGIGGLVQQIVGDVEMTTDSGAPTDMGMGVGSLMAAGAQEAPTPQNFRQGGEVARMNEGGDPAFFRPSEVLTQYEALLPLFQSITSADERAAEAEEQRERDKFQLLMSTAGSGLRLAAGIPDAGSSFASQVGAAFEPTVQDMAAIGSAAQKRRTDLRAEDRALRAAALQGAMGIQTAEAKGRQDLAVAEAKAGRTKPELRVITDIGTGKKIFVDINTASGAAAVQRAGAANAAAPQGNAFSVNTVSSDSERGAKAFMIDGVPRISLDGGTTYLDTENMNQTMPTNAIPLSDERAYDIIATQARRDAAAEQLRNALGGDGSTNNILTATVKGGERGAPVALTEDEKVSLTSILTESPDPLTAAQEGTGFKARFSATLDNIYGGVFETQEFQDTQSYRQYLKGIKVLGRSALVVNPRFPVAEMENVGALFPDADTFFVNPVTEANKLIEMKRLAQEQLLRNLQYISTSAPSDMIADIEANNRELERLLGILSSVPMTYQTNDQQTQVTNALRDAIKGKRN